MSSRLTLYLCILALVAVLPCSAQKLTSSLCRRPYQVPAGGGLEPFYGTIENPTSSQIYLTYASFTTDGVVFETEDDLNSAIQAAKEFGLVPGLPVAPHSIGYDSEIGIFNLPGSDTSPLPRTPTIYTMHLRGVIGNSTHEVDLGDCRIVLNPYLPIVSNLNHRTYHYKPDKDKGYLTIGGKIWNSYHLDYTTPTIPTIPTLQFAMIELDDPSGLVGIVDRQLEDAIAAHGGFYNLPLGVVLDFTDGMYTFSIPSGVTSFTGRVLFWDTQVEGLAEGYADFTVIVDP